MRSFVDLTGFLDLLRREGELHDIRVPVSPEGVIPEIQRRTVAMAGPALLFHQVGDASFPVATNLFGSQKRLDLAFGGKPEQIIRDMVRLLEQMPPKSLSELWAFKHLVPTLARVGRKTRKKGPILANKLDSLEELPALTCWPEDGGPFITLPLVYTQHPVSGKGNLGMYRVQIQGPRQAGMHIQIHRGGGNHYHAAEEMGQDLPALVYVGGHPALTLAAVAPLPEDVPELAFASLLMGRKLEMVLDPQASPLPIPAHADFCLAGRIPAQRRAPEGPFGDHYGYYSLKHDYPYLEVDHIFYRDGAVWPATVVGRPPQEDHFIAIYLQDLFAPLFPVVMKGVRDVFAYEASGIHSLAAAIVRERYHKEAFTACMRVLGEGQLSLSKVLMATESDLDLRRFRPFLEHIVARCDFRTDLHIFANISLDSLDYTGPAINQGSKAVFLGLGEARFTLETRPPASFSNSDFGGARVFCAGVLVVKGPEYKTGNTDPQRLLAMGEIEPFRLVFLHDDPDAAVESDAAFLWYIFTRFEPAGDLYGNRQIRRNHLAFEAPLVIDCRMKPGYPKVLEPDPETVEEVDRIWDRLGIERFGN